MSHCKKCRTKFTFFDVLKGFNPASIKCRGCSARVESSYATLTSAISIVVILSAGFWSLPIAKGPYGGEVKFVFLAILAYLFEYTYYYLLTSGRIRSNLGISGSEEE